MATTNSKLKHLAESQSKTVPDLIAGLVNQYGTVVKASAAIDISPSTMRLHMRLHGLKAVRREVIVYTGSAAS